MQFSIHFLHNKIMYPTSKIQISSPQFSNFDQTCLKKFAEFFSPLEMCHRELCLQDVFS